MTARAAALLLAGALASPAAAAQRAAPDPPAGPPPGDWSMPGRDWALSRYSPLGQITAANVAGLRPVWTFSTGALRAHEGSPLVVGSVLYVHTPFPNAVFALDLNRPGAPILWRYEASPPAGARRGAAQPPNSSDGGSRGLAWHQSGKLYVPLQTGELAALDAETGRVLWRVRNGDGATGATMSAAPLVVRDLVIVGVSSSGVGIRGHLTAYDAHTGRLAWRGYSTGPDAEVRLGGPANPNYSSHQGRDLGVTTWAGDGWQRGGGTTSGWLSYDPELDLVFHGTDEPAPGNPALRPGDNKWTASLLAREAATGQVRWALQLTPHDEWGYSAANESILVSLQLSGRPVRALVHFDRNGFAYTIDRATGRILLAEKFGPANWASAVDGGTGVPGRDPRYAAPVDSARVRGVCPASVGFKHLQPAAFSPLTNLFYVPVSNLCMDLAPGRAAAGRQAPPTPPRTVRMVPPPGPGGAEGRFIAWDAGTASIRWEAREPLPVTGGSLTTAGGLVFYGTMDGWLKALDQHTGRELWSFKTPSGIVGSPIAFEGPDGRQYVAVLSGSGGPYAVLDRVTTPGGVLMVFGL